MFCLAIGTCAKIKIFLRSVICSTMCDVLVLYDVVQWHRQTVRVRSRPKKKPARTRKQTVNSQQHISIDPFIVHLSPNVRLQPHITYHIEYIAYTFIISVFLQLIEYHLENGETLPGRIDSIASPPQLLPTYLPTYLHSGFAVHGQPWHPIYALDVSRKN